MALFQINGTRSVLLGNLPVVLDRQLRDIESTIGPTGSATLAFEPGDYRIYGEFEFGPSVAWWFAPGAVLDVRGQLLIQGPVCATAQQIFATRIEGESATSRVFLHGSPVQQVPEVLPQWWGAGLEDDQGRGLQAMAQSLAFAHPTLISFGPGTYLARPMTFKPGHRFAAPRLATLKAALPSPFLMTILHEGSQKAPRTSFEGLLFEGHEPPAPNRAATSPSPTQDLLVVRSTRRSEVPLTLVWCTFSKASGTGLLLHSGASIQAHGLFANQCQTAGLAMRSSNAPSTLQWSNRDFPQRLFAADVILGDLSSKTVLQLSDVTLQGRLHVRGNAQSRMTLVRCQIKETLNIHAPGAYLVVVESHIESQNRAESQVQSPAVALFGKGCTWSTTPDRGEDGFVEPALMTIQWEDQEGLDLSLITGPVEDFRARRRTQEPICWSSLEPSLRHVTGYLNNGWSRPDQEMLEWPGVFLVGNGIFNEPDDFIGKSTGLRAHGRSSGRSPIIVLDDVTLGKSFADILVESAANLQRNFTGIQAENKLDLFVQGSTLVGNVSLGLNSEIRLAVSTSRKPGSFSFFGPVYNLDFLNPSCIQFMGKPRLLPALVLLPPGTEGLSCVLGGRLLVQHDNGQLPTWAFRGDLIVRSAQPSIEPAHVCLRSSRLETVWRDVISGNNERCSS